jgi:Arc/MetJ-type ribon-helix-helix transcriptional regulator
MDTTKITISLVPELLDELDRLVREGVFTSRSEAIQQALREKLGHLGRPDVAEGAERLKPERSGIEAQDAEPADWQDVEG